MMELQRRESREVSGLPEFRRLSRVPDAPFLGGQQSKSYLVQVGQGEQGIELHGVLRQPPIPDHGMTPLPLDYPERKLNDGTQRSDHFVLKLLPEGQFVATRGSMRGMQRDSRLASQRSIGLTTVAAIAQHFVLSPVQQLRQHVLIRLPRRGSDERMHHPRVQI